MESYSNWFLSTKILGIATGCLCASPSYPTRNIKYRILNFLATLYCSAVVISTIVVNTDFFTDLYQHNESVFKIIMINASFIVLILTGTLILIASLSLSFKSLELFKKIEEFNTFFGPVVVSLNSMSMLKLALCTSLIHLVREIVICYRSWQSRLSQIDHVPNVFLGMSVSGSTVCITSTIFMISRNLLILVWWYAFQFIFTVSLFLVDNFKVFISQIEQILLKHHTKQFQSYEIPNRQSINLKSALNSEKIRNMELDDELKFYKEVWNKLMEIHSYFSLVGGIFLGIMFPLTICGLVPRLTFGIVNADASFQYFMQVLSGIAYGLRVISLIEIGHQFKTRVIVDDLVKIKSIMTH